MNYKDIKIEDTHLRVYENGEISRIYNDILKPCKLGLTTNGYRQLRTKKTTYTAHRIIGYAFLGLDIDNPKQIIDHINHKRDDNRIENLRIVNHKENNFNTKDTNGFTKVNKKFRASISINNKTTHIGYFKTKEEAHNAYLEAKEKHHKIIGLM